jgi:hypothetical protein
MQNVPPSVFDPYLSGGSIVTTAEDLNRLISWAPRANCPVVLDTTGVAWILVSTVDGDTYAGTIESDEDTGARYEVDDLPAERGPLYVLFNGDSDALTHKGVQQ